MASPQTLIVKIHFGMEIRRFTSTASELTWDRLSERVTNFFDLSVEKKKIKVTYIDDEKDVITISTDDELREAVALALATEPSVLRLTIVKLEKKAGGEPKAGEPVKLAEQPTQPREPTSSTSVPPPFVPPDMPADLAPFFESLAKQLPAAMANLPEGLKAMIPHAELDLAATLAANTPTRAGQRPTDQYCPAEPHAPDAKEGVHAGVTCDKSGVCPIVGNRYHLVGHNYDLCEAEWMKLSDKEKALFRKVLPPGAAPPPAAAPAGQPDGPPADGVHPGVQCDRSGMCPIVGMRYHLRGHNYDLCRAEFDKLPEAEKGLYTAIPPPATAGAGPWRPGPWGWRGGGCGGPRGGMGMGGHGQCGTGRGPHSEHHCKLAARFVRDVTIFDGTQMAPGTNFTKIWKLKNVGEVPWPPGTRMLFVGGDQMTSEMSVPLSRAAAVMPGEEVDVAVEMTAPAEHGRYLGYWRLTGPYMRRKFGQRVWCHVQVVDPSQSGAEAFDDLPSALAEIERKKSDLAAADAAGDEPELLSGEEGVKATPPVDVSEAASAAAASATPMMAEPKMAEPMTSTVEREEPEVGEPSKDGDISDDGVLVSVESSAGTPSAGGKAKVDMNVEEPTGVRADLASMGFVDDALVDAVVAKHGEDVEACARDLATATEWVHLLDDLQEMGFANRELNMSLMLKNGGNLKRTVRDLVEA